MLESIDTSARHLDYFIEDDESSLESRMRTQTDQLRAR